MRCSLHKTISTNIEVAASNFFLLGYDIKVTTNKFLLFILYMHGKSYVPIYVTYIMHIFECFQIWKQKIVSIRKDKYSLHSEAKNIKNWEAKNIVNGKPKKS